MPDIGILGGTFDPPHIGHLVFAQEALLKLGLERILFMPARTPPHKSERDLTDVGRRIEMCRLAVRGDPRFQVDLTEADRPGVSYTAETLDILRQRGESEPVLLLGGDQAMALGSWREPRSVVGLARLAVAPRRSEQAEVSRELARLGAEGRFTFVDMPRIDVSSSALRARVSRDLPIRYLVPPAVERYVAREGLYR